MLHTEHDEALQEDILLNDNAAPSGYEQLPVMELYRRMRSGDNEAALWYAKRANESNEPEECIGILREIDDGDFTDIEALRRKWELLGDAYFKTGEISEAVSCYRNAKELHSEKSLKGLLLCELERCRSRMTMPSDALGEKDLRELELAAFDGDPDLSYDIGLLYQYRRNKMHSLVFFKNVLEDETASPALRAKCKYHLWKNEEPDETGEIPAKDDIEALLEGLLTEEDDDEIKWLLQSMRNDRLEAETTAILQEKMPAADTSAAARPSQTGEAQAERKKGIKVSSIIIIIFVIAAVYAFAKTAMSSFPEVETPSQDTYYEIGNEYEYILPYSDSIYYERSAIEGMDADEVQFAINEIYARHGRNFGNDPYKSHFNSCSWYESKYSSEEFDEGWFNEYEIANIHLLVDYAEEKGYR